MIVHLVAPLESANNDIETLRRIIKVIHEGGHSLAKNWIEPQYFRPNELPVKDRKLEWDIICRQQVSLIKGADLVIAEASGYSTFGVGHQVALAQQFNKPVLLLTRSTPQYGAYIDGLGHGLTDRQEYIKGDLDAKVKAFIERFER